MTARAALLVGITALVVSACAGDSREPRQQERRTSPYAGLEKRSIAALSDQRVADLLAGRGAGYALAAELNHYPGPMHVLELAEPLGLSARQRAVARRESAAVHARARALGRRLVAAERRLDRLFRRGSATAGAVTELTARVARLDGELRSLHLRAHVRMRQAMTERQLARYDALRGYSSGARRHDGGRHGHGSPAPP